MMAHPYDKQAKTGQEIADARYGDLSKGDAGSAQGDAAKQPEEVFTGAPARQVSNKGNVRK